MTLFATASVCAQSVPERVATGDVAPGVHRAEEPGTVPVRFELRGPGSEPIGLHVNGAAAWDAGAFVPACATPCTLWFERGRTYVQLGQSIVRSRVRTLDVESRARHVVFTRDQPAGVVAGVMIAGLGLISMIIGIPFAATRQDPGPFIGLAAGGAAAFTTGALITGFSFGWSTARDE